MQKKVQQIALLLLLITLFVGCKSRPTGEVQQLNRRDVQLLEKQLERQPVFNTFTTKMKVRLGGELGNFSSSATLRLERDKALEISLTPLLGIELFRLTLTPDSVLVVDRTKRRYLASPLAPLLEEFAPGYSFASLQSLLLGELFLPDTPHLTAAELPLFGVELRADGGATVSAPRKSHMELSFQIDNKQQVTETRLKQTKIDVASQWMYSNYTTSLPKIPAEIAISNQLREKEITLQIQYNSPTWNQAWQGAIVIPRGYRQIDSASLLQKLNL